MSFFKKILAGLGLCLAFVACNQNELQSLEFSGSITTINEQIANINATIEELKNADAAIIAQQGEQNATIAASITKLENYINERLGVSFPDFG